MKIIDLLNKIANGEESDTITEFEFDKRIWNFFTLQDSEFCVDGWLLNQEIVITKHKEIIEEDKKIEKIKSINCESFRNNHNGIRELTDVEIALDIITLKEWINKVIDKLNEENK